MIKTDEIKGNEENAKAKGPSKMAEMIALHRVAESALPEGIRIFYDPYAVHFIDPQVLLLSRKDPEKAKAMRDHYERLFPGLGNSIRARVRCFDDFVKASIDEGIEQLVILGAGYDTRAYRIEGLKDKVRTFEVDHPSTQGLKIEKIKKIFGALPDVVYVTVDFESEDLGKKLLEKGYIRSQKTLFVMEGLVMYIPPGAVDAILSFIAVNSGSGSRIIFDYYPQSVVDGTSNLETAKNIRDHLIQLGEPLQFGISEAEPFLEERGFSQVRTITSEDYKREYFNGPNKDRAVCSLLYFVNAVIE